MRVYDGNLTGAASAGTGRTQEVQPTGRGDNTRTTQRTASGDRVELSSALGRLSRAMASYESARSNRVQSLAAQFQAGTYRPDSAATSRGMISDALGGK